MDDPHQEGEPDQPDWDSFEPYSGPEKEELNPILSRIVSVLAPILMVLLSFFAGGSLLCLIVFRSRGTRRAVVHDDEALPSILEVFIAGGGAAALIAGGFIVTCLWRRKDRE